MAIGGAGAVTSVYIRRQLDLQLFQYRRCVINLAAGTASLSQLAGGTAAQANGFSCPNCAMAQNYYTDIGDVSAILDPVAT